MIPADSDDIRKDYAVLLGELTQYNPELLDKERLLAITKCDMLDEDLIEEMKSHLPEGFLSVFISSISGMNIPRLKDMLWEALQNKDTESIKARLGTCNYTKASYSEKNTRLCLSVRNDGDRSVGSAAIAGFSDSIV